MIGRFKEKMIARWRPYVLTFFLISNGILWYAVWHEDRRGVLTVAFLDVGQGDAIFIEAPNGDQVLIDGGPDGTVLRRLGEVMPFYDRSIDMLISSTPDSEHATGLINVLGSYRVDTIMESGTLSPSSAYKALEDVVDKKEIRRIAAKRGMKLMLAPGVFLYVLFPDRDVSTLGTNVGSIVAKLVYGKTSVLLTGDAPQNIEKYLIGLDREGLRSDILKIAHYGSHVSTAASFVKEVQPKYAVISAGAHNRYGFPQKETLDTLGAQHVSVLSTLGKGTLYFQSDGSKWQEKQLPP